MPLAIHNCANFLARVSKNGSVASGTTGYAVQQLMCSTEEACGERETHGQDRIMMAVNGGRTLNVER